MLGEQVGEEKGKTTSLRVLDVQPPKMEISFSWEGKYRGVDGTVSATYWSVLRPDGVLFGEGQAMIMSRDGQEMVTSTGQGIGHLVGGEK